MKKTSVCLFLIIMLVLEIILCCVLDRGFITLFLFFHILLMGYTLWSILKKPPETGSPVSPKPESLQPKAPPPQPERIPAAPPASVQPQSCKVQDNYDFDYHIEDDGTVTLTSYYHGGQAAVIPEQIEGYPVTAIGAGAFQNCDWIRSVTLPHSITSIGDYAFDGCSSLEQVILPKGLVSIGQYAFQHCGFTALELPESLRQIEAYAFQDTSLEFITVPNGVTHIGDYAFSFSGLVSAALPDGLLSLGDYAFGHCRSLFHLNLPSSLQQIGSCAFFKCNNLSQIVIPEKVTVIENNTFTFCKNLHSVFIPNSVTHIGQCAFAECPKLTLQLPPCDSEPSAAKQYALSEHIRYLITPAPEPFFPEQSYLTETEVYGMHRYHRLGDDSSVYLVNESLHICKQLVDSNGNIQNFPGVVIEDFWYRKVSATATYPQIRFRTCFQECEKGWIMLWQIQPYGMYWADEGHFGIENDEEIRLYTHIDTEGNFTGPFRVYNVGDRQYCTQ